MFKVAFTGHRPDKLPGGYRDYDSWGPKTQALVVRISEELISLREEHGEMGVITGGALGVDTIAAAAAVKVDIPFVVITPTGDVNPRWSKASKDRFEKMLKRTSPELLFSLVENDFPIENPPESGHFALHGPWDPEFKNMDSFQFWVWAAEQRNRWMIDHANFLIAVLNGGVKGGTANAIRYATRIGREMTIISP